MKIKITPKQWKIVVETMDTVREYGDWGEEHGDQLRNDLSKIDWMKGELTVPDTAYRIAVYETRISQHIEEYSFAELFAETIETLVDTQDWAPASYSPLVKKLKGTWTGVKKKPTTYGERKKEAEQIVRDVVKAGMKVRMGLPVRTKTPDVKMSWHKGRSNCWGGAKYISIAMAKYVPKLGEEKESYWLREYSHIKNSPTIGEFESDDWRLPLIAVTCHELAHSLQSQQTKAFHPQTQIFKRAHGDGWRMIYRELRDALVNNSLHG